MPEIAVAEDSETRALEHKVWTSWKGSVMGAVGKIKAVEGLA
jgi:hypothetical protein